MCKSMKLTLALVAGLALGTTGLTVTSPVTVHAQLKHTVTIKGHRYASKYTIKQMRSKYHLAYHSSGRYNYRNKVWAYSKSARSGFWDATNVSSSHYKTHAGHYILFKSYAGGNMSTFVSINLNTGKRYNLTAAHLG